MLDEKSFSFGKRLVLKIFFNSFVFAPLLFFLLMIFFVKLLDTSPSDLGWVILFFSIIVTLALVHGWANFSSQVLRIKNFRFSLGENTILFRQAIMWCDTARQIKLAGASYILGRKTIWDWISTAVVLFIKRKKIIEIKDSEIRYASIGSVLIRRSFVDTLWGISKVVITQKDVTYSKFSPPGVYDYPGDTSLYQTLMYAGKPGIFVIPGIDKNRAILLVNSIKEQAQKLGVIIGSQDNLTEELSKSSIIEIIVGVFSIFILSLLIIWFVGNFFLHLW